MPAYTIDPDQLVMPQPAPTGMRALTCSNCKRVFYHPAQAKGPVPRFHSDGCRVTAFRKRKRARQAEALAELARHAAELRERPDVATWLEVFREVRGGYGQLTDTEVARLAIALRVRRGTVGLTDDPRLEARE